MEIELMTVGKTTIRFVEEGIAEYSKRLKHYIPYSIKSLPDVKNASKMDQAKQKEAEGEKILDAISNSDFVVLLDERGKQYSSIEFSAFLEKQMISGRRKVVFVVGGPYGFSQPVYDRADSLLSLSKMTFNHEMVRLFFTEQIYRAMTILRGEPYHHE
mgnify:CR=1 FL=1